MEATEPALVTRAAQPVGRAASRTAPAAVAARAARVALLGLGGALGVRTLIVLLEHRAVLRAVIGATATMLLAALGLALALAAVLAFRAASGRGRDPGLGADLRKLVVAAALAWLAFLAFAQPF